MLLSMTGFGTREVELKSRQATQPIHISIEIKTLNARFFEASSKLPVCLSSLEGKVNALLKARLNRGRAFLVVRTLGDCSQFESLIFSHQLAKSYINVSREVQKELSIPGELSISDLVSLPHIFVLEKTTIGEDAEKQFLAHLDSVLDDVVSMRAQEGSFLKKDLLDYINIPPENLQ